MTVAGHSTPAIRRPNAPARARHRALAIGASVGFLAGIVWGREIGKLAVHSEKGAAIGVASQSDAELDDVGPHGSPQDRHGRADEPFGSVATVRSGRLPNHASSLPQDSTTDPKVEGTACPSGMRLVEGDYCTMVSQLCIEPYTDGSGRCRRFAENARCYPPVVSLRFCMDQYEFPNKLGEKPRVMVNFREAQQECQEEGKRLCSAREWTLACEGPDRLPYPNGYSRIPGVCNIDQPHRFPNVDALNNPAAMPKELQRLDQRVPSGSRPGCVSQFGIYDLVGNVDEWVAPDGIEEAAGFGAAAALKGGYFGPVRSRCRPSTPTHGPTFKFYQVGFRCCLDFRVGEDNSSGR